MKPTGWLIGAVIVAIVLIAIVLALVLLKDPVSPTSTAAGTTPSVVSPPRPALSTPQRVRRTPVATRPVPKAALGAAIEPTENGILVNGVLPGSTAAAAGLQPNDMILSIDEKRVRTINAVLEKLAAHDVGDEIVLHIQRDGRETALRVKLMSRPEAYEMPPGVHRAVTQPTTLRTPNSTLRIRG